MLRFAQCWYHMHSSEICSFQFHAHNIVGKRFNDITVSYVEGILPKGPYPPCLRMADRAPLAGYPRCKIKVKYQQTKLWVDVDITRHTAHAIVQWPNPKQWLMIHTFDLLMQITKRSTHVLMVISREMSELKPHSLTHCKDDTWKKLLQVLYIYSTEYTWQAFYMYLLMYAYKRVRTSGSNIPGNLHPT